MPVFTFSGKNASGEKIQGERVAANKDGLASQLRKERITPGSIREKGKEFAMPTLGRGKVKVKDVAIFFRQFSVMIDAGLPLVQTSVNHDGKLAEEYRHVFDLDLAPAESGHRKFLALLADGAGSDALFSQLGS